MYNHRYSNFHSNSNSPSSEENNKDKKLKYILSIGKKHIVFFVIMMFTVFGLFFLLGIATGYSIGGKSSPPSSSISVIENEDLDNYNNFDTSTLSSETSNSLNEGEKFVSQQVQIDENFNEEDILNTSTKNNKVKIKPIKRKAKTNPKPSKKKVSKTSSSKSKRKNFYVNKPVPGVQYYYIQVIATSDIAKAQKIYNRLRIRKYPVKVKKSNKDGKYLYAIRVGLYTSKKLSLRHLRLIRKGGGYTQAFMKSYKVEPQAIENLSKTTKSKITQSPSTLSKEEILTLPTTPVSSLDANKLTESPLTLPPQTTE